MFWLINLSTNGIKKASYSVTRMMTASRKLQGFLHLLAVCFKVAYRKIDSIVYFNVVKLLHVKYNESLILFDRSESSKLGKVLKVS